MKVAVTFAEGSVYQHFGHTQFFKIFEVEKGMIQSAEVVPTEGAGHGALAVFLHERGVEALICGGIGGGAIAALRDAGIRVCAGVSGNADQAVQDLLDGTLRFSGAPNCSHHAHESGHDECGSHGAECGHSCGSER